MSVLTFDCDGVCATFTYIPPEHRSAAAYAGIEPMEEMTGVMNQLTRHNNVYIISSRSYKHAVEGTYEWFNNVGVKGLAGIICGIEPWRKPMLCTMLNTRLHVDDDPDGVVPMIELGHGLLMQNDVYPKNELARRIFPFVTNWADIQRVMIQLKLFGPPRHAIQQEMVF